MQSSKNDTASACSNPEPLMENLTVAHGQGEELSITGNHLLQEIKP